MTLQGMNFELKIKEENAMPNTKIKKEFLDELLENYQDPEDVFGKYGILKQLTKSIVE